LPIALKEGVSAFMGIQPQKARSKLILVVDDDAMYLKLVNRAPSNRGYQVHEVRDGVEAIRIARREVPDMILLDLGLPQRDGYEVMERLKVTGSTEKIPVVVVSASLPPRNKKRPNESGRSLMWRNQLRLTLCVASSPRLSTKSRRPIEHAQLSGPLAA
jgi:two-component system cell cycle response regulator DivK